MAILQPYKVNSYRRICDICGRPRQIEDIRFADNVAICSIHPQYRTAQQLNRINARTRPIRILPVPQPKPFAPVDTWTAEESQIFNFVLATAPYDTVDVTSNAGAIVGVRSYQSYGWAILYLCALLEENKRPATWLTAARTKAIALGRELLTFQTPVTPLGASSGGFRRRTLNPTDTNSIWSSDNSLACAALCRLYAVTGQGEFSRGARDTAIALANLHAVTLYSSGAAATYYGALPQQLVSGVMVDDYYPADLLGLWALTLVQGLFGNITIGQQGGGGAFAASPARPIADIIADIRAFWTNGYGGINGFSAATPYDHFSGSTATWTNIGTIVTSAWATGIYALTQLDGISDQVTALWTMFRSFIYGGYDPTLAPPSQFIGNTPTVPFYDFASAGLMAEITSAKSRASIKALKDVLALPRPRYVEATPRGAEVLYLGPLGASTFAFEPYSYFGQRYRSVVAASQASFVYREQPQGFLGRGH